MWPWAVNLGCFVAGFIAMIAVIALWRRAPWHPVTAPAEGFAACPPAPAPAGRA